MNTKALRQKILDLAIRGKLVPQDPNDEPASVLLERVRAEKQQMVRGGKLKAKDIKNDTIIFVGEDNLHYEKFQDGTVKCIEDEIPFEVPEGWEWCRLNDLFSVCSAKRVLQSDWKTEGVPFYRAREIVKLAENNYVENELFIAEEHYQDMIQNYGIPQENDLMVSAVGTIGKVYIVKKEDRFYYKDASVICFQNINKIIDSKYAKIMFESSFLQQQMIRNSKGTTVDTITISIAMTYLCVLPPLKEQINIALSVEKILALVDDMSARKEELHCLIGNAKTKILDLAIRGQLVKQEPNDEPASILLESIRAEKEKLIKQGKIKRDKQESIIFRGDDNSYYEKIGDTIENIDSIIPFNIPDNWEFIRFKELWELISGRDLSPAEYNEKNIGIPYITGASNFNKGNIELVRWTSNPQVITHTGDLLITCKGTIGEMAFNYFGDAHIARQIMAIRNIFNLNAEYLSLCIFYYINTIKRSAKGLIPGISREDILNLILPLPPVDYQNEVALYIKKTNDVLHLMEKSLI